MKRASSNKLTLTQQMVLGWLLLCLVLGQSLSHAHRALHLGHHEPHSEHISHSAPSHADHDHDHHSSFADLFVGHAQGDESCQLLAVTGTLLKTNSHLASVLITQSAIFSVAFTSGWPSAGRASLFEARAPPAPFASLAPLS